MIVLHGGASRQRDLRVSPTQLSVVRMIPIASRIARVTQRRLVVVRLLNSRRGWDNEHTPVGDVQWALAQLAERFGELPVCLVGHSLGGRAALLAASEAQVRGVVALAPWLLPADTVTAPRDTPIVIIHGDGDRIARPERSRALAERLGRDAEVAYVSVTGGAHAMLRRTDAFDRLAAQCVKWMLLGELDGDAVRRIAGGERWLTL